MIRIFFKRCYLFIWWKESTSRESSRGRGRTRLPEQGVKLGAQSQDPEIMTWAEGRCLTDWATQVPLPRVFKLPIAVWKLTHPIAPQRSFLFYSVLVPGQYLVICTSESLGVPPTWLYFWLSTPPGNIVIRQDSRVLRIFAFEFQEIILCLYMTLIR